jgi:hypothetical protein
LDGVDCGRRNLVSGFLTFFGRQRCVICESALVPTEP